MSAIFKKYKSKFRYSLRPFFVMIKGKRKAMSDSEWSHYVDDLKAHVLSNPIEFLGEDLPDQNLTTNVVDDVFDEFVKELAYLRNGSSKVH